MSIEEHLEHIRADINDPAPYLVFADWLQEQGHAWGQLITLQHELEQRPGDGAIAAAVEALLKKHKWAPKHKPSMLRLEWRWGFIHAVRVFDEYSYKDSVELLASVLELPMAALLSSCVVFRDPRYHSAAELDAAVKRLSSPTTIELVAPLHLGLEEDLPKGATADEATRALADEDVRWVSVHGAVPTDIGRFEKMVLLNCGGAETLPKAVGDLPLDRLDIDYCGRLRSIPDTVWGIESLGHISMYDCHGLGLNMAQVNNLLFGFVQAKTPREQRIFEAAIFRGRTPKCTVEQLLFALDNNVKSVRVGALAMLEKKLKEPLAEHPVGTGSVITLLGGLN
ncbi:MAG: TIGR02996 domain-containing protein, partial [Deltaproteobacteria bacterium]|nr:TIGR02996 domain-containing protein [Deltaproteobacteria bacterium]